jgi:predicted aspartyl protease
MNCRRFAVAGFLAATAIAVFAAPSQAQSSAAFVTDAKAPVILPAVFDDRVLLQGTVNGHSLWFHLDSGAPIFAMGTDDARAAGVSVAGGSQLSTPVDFAIGGIHAPAARFYVAPYGFDLHGRRVSGLFGAPLLLSFVVTVDYARKTVTAYPPGTFDSASLGVAASAVSTKGGYFYTDVCFGSTCAPFLVDMGSSISQVTEAFGRRIGLSNPIGSVDTFGFTHEKHTNLEYATDLTVGGVTFKNLAIMQGVDSTNGIGILGRDVLKHFAVTFDWADSRMYFVPEIQKT